MEKLTSLLSHFAFQFLPEEPLLGISTERGGVELEKDVFTPYYQISVGIIFFKIIYSNIDWNNRL